MQRIFLFNTFELLVILQSVLQARMEGKSPEFKQVAYSVVKKIRETICQDASSARKDENSTRN